jgi:hypothetical protein
MMLHTRRFLPTCLLLTLLALTALGGAINYRAELQRSH